MSKKRRGYLYVRVSALPQIRDLIIQMQLSALRQYALLNNIEIIATIIDDESGTEDLSYEFYDMLHAAQIQNIDVILVFSVDRIARNLKGIRQMIELLNQTGIEVESVSESLPNLNPDEWAEYFYLRGLFSYLSTRERSRHMKKMMRQNRQVNFPTPPNDEE